VTHFIFVADITVGDWIAIVSAIISVIALIVSGYFAACAERAAENANKDAERANVIAVGQSETQVRSAISSQQQTVQGLGIQIAVALKGKKPADLDAKDKSLFDVLDKAYEHAVELQLNSYEDACGKYRDDKIDRVRFKQSYVSEIRNLCESKTDSIHRLLHPRDTSKYRAIWAVYDEWNNLEANPGT
jgi:hypothetical protein